MNESDVLDIIESKVWPSWASRQYAVDVVCALLDEELYIDYIWWSASGECRFDVGGYCCDEDDWYGSFTARFEFDWDKVSTPVGPRYRLVELEIYDD